MAKRHQAATSCKVASHNASDGVYAETALLCFEVSDSRWHM